MAKRQQTYALQPVVDVLIATTKRQPQVASFGPKMRQVQVATIAEYPKPELTTLVTIGASRHSPFMYRGLEEGFELTLTLSKPDTDIAAKLAGVVLENLRLVNSGERRPIIEYNGIYAPGYAPHWLFTEQLTNTPKLSGRKRCGDRWVSFLAAIPLSDAELREYDKSVPNLIATLKRDGRTIVYPR